ncbi:hypothetical protein D3C71_1685810 [compost metagenome]
MVEQVERRHHQHQAGAHQCQQDPLGGVNSFTKHHAIEQRDERREAGKTQGRHGDAADFHGEEKRYPVRGQHGTGEQHHAQPATVEPFEQGPTLQQRHQPQRQHGERRTTKGNHRGLGVDQRAEDAGQAEQHGGDMGNDQAVAV